jgi:hypothetical protein
VDATRRCRVANNIPDDPRWPAKGDRIFYQGQDARAANSLGERVYRLAKGYKLAGDTLVYNFLGEHRDYDDLNYPILFCYRHYIELTLKEIVQKHGPWVDVLLPDENHKLPELWGLFLQVATAYGNDPQYEAAAAVASCITELAKFDPSSFAFRYASYKKRTGKLIPLEFGTIDLDNLHDVMDGIANFIECAEADFSSKRDALMAEIDRGGI